MSDAGFALQQAIYAALNGNLGTGVAVYDHVPQDASYPYVSIDAQEMAEADYVTERMDERFIYLSVWSQYRGQTEVQEILAAIDAALHNKRLPMNTGTMITCKIKRKSSRIDADGVTYQGNATVMVMIDY